MTCPLCLPPRHVVKSTDPCPSTTLKMLVLAELHLHGLDTEHGTIFPRVG